MLQRLLFQGILIYSRRNFISVFSFKQENMYFVRNAFSRVYLELSGRLMNLRKHSKEFQRKSSARG